ncbi:MAG: diguanylate cyclase, partial [Psychromonas sp.]
IITGRSLYDLPDLIPKKNADIYYQKDAELLKKMTQQSYEAKVKCADGIERYYHFYKSTLVVDNKILGLVGVMLDVSQYKNTLSELDKINTALNKVSITDWLTGLYNRRYFEDVFEQKITSLSRCKQAFSFALLDIDFFKCYNDTYGHAAGDLALQKVSSAIRQTVSRKNDYIFRVGGEEFALLFECNSPSDAVQLINKLKANIENLKITAGNSIVSPYLTISIGLGNLNHIDSQSDSSSIYREIDQLLYQSKMHGRNKITVKEIV